MVVRKSNNNSKRIIFLILLAIVVATSFGVFKHIQDEKAREEAIAKEKAELEKRTKAEMKHITLGLRGTNPAIVKEGDPYVDSGAFSLDDRDGSIKALKVEGEDKVDTSKPGSYQVEYIYSKDGVKDKVLRKVNVIPKKDFKDNELGIPVLMYHYVYTDNDIPKWVHYNYIHQRNLEAQLKYLKDEKYYFPSFKELRAYIDGKISLPEKSVILTFDDGDIRFLKYGIESLNKYKIPAISFYIGNFGLDRIKEYHSPYVSFESHSYDMHRGGGTVGMGGRISAMTKDEIKADLAKNAKLLGSNDAFAYPYGDTTPDAQQAIRENGILCSFTTEYSKVRKGMDPTKLPRVRVVGTESLDTFIASISY